MPKDDTKNFPEKLAEAKTPPPGGRAPYCAFDRGDGGDGPPAVRVTMDRSGQAPTSDQYLWVIIREGTRRLGFDRYKDFIDALLCKPDLPDTGDRNVNLDEFRYRSRFGGRIAGVNAYQTLKAATEAFLLIQCGVAPERPLFRTGDPDERLRDENARLGDSLTEEQIANRLRIYLGGNVDQLLALPYFKRVLRTSFSRGEGHVNSPFCEGILNSRLEADKAPCLLELIWSYWHEQAMLVQAVNMVALRFQNRSEGPGAGPLTRLTLDPLRPLSNLLWGYIQDEHNRLTVPRRAYEYDHQYGITLEGKAVPVLRPADSRSTFLQGFHRLLFEASQFFKQDDDTMIKADGFPMLQALKEVHLVLAEGAHNQFGDLPWTARVEMLVQQWLMARPEMRDFLGARPMVPLAESWMPQVDVLKRATGWYDANITHFHDMAVYGEQVLLSVRYGDWVDVTDPNQASNWARYWRPEIQTYIHAYRAATGADLTVEPVSGETPSSLLRKRMALQPAANQ